MSWQKAARWRRSCEIPSIDLEGVQGLKIQRDGEALQYARSAIVIEGLDIRGICLPHQPIAFLLFLDI